MTIIRIVEFHNLFRLVVWYDAIEDGWRWRVARLDSGDYWLYGESTKPLALEAALKVGRKELAVWSDMGVSA